MKKTVLICGIAAGLISTSMFIGMIILGKGTHDVMENGMIYGFSLMILAFSLIFVGTKITRDKHNGGVISFWKAFRVGLYISLIASSIYVLVWIFDLYMFDMDFAERYAAQSLEKLKSSGASAETIAKETASMESFKEMYKNPIFVILLTYVEILPIGILVTLISAFTLKRSKKAEPAIA